MGITRCYTVSWGAAAAASPPTHSRVLRELQNLVFVRTWIPSVPLWLEGACVSITGGMGLRIQPLVTLPSSLGSAVFSKFVIHPQKPLCNGGGHTWAFPLPDAMLLVAHHFLQPTRPWCTAYRLCWSKDSTCPEEIGVPKTQAVARAKPRLPLYHTVRHGPRSGWWETVAPCPASDSAVNMTVQKMESSHPSKSGGMG